MANSRSFIVWSLLRRLGRMNSFTVIFYWTAVMAAELIRFRQVQTREFRSPTFFLLNYITCEHVARVEDLKAAEALIHAMVHAKSTCLVPIVTHNFVHQTNYNLLQMCKYFPERNLEGSLHRYRSTLLLAVLLFRLFEGHTGVVRAESSLVGIITRSRGFSIATKSFSLICKVTCLVFGALTCFFHLKSLSK